MASRIRPREPTARARAWWFGIGHVAMAGSSPASCTHPHPVHVVNREPLIGSVIPVRVDWHVWSVGQDHPEYLAHAWQAHQQRRALPLEPDPPETRAERSERRVDALDSCQGCLV